MTRRRRRVTQAAAAVAVAVVAALLPASTATADVAGPYFATQGLGSDPHIIECTYQGVDGYCLYTSQDMGASYRYPGNYYPMRYTRAYFSENGYSGWTGGAVVVNESSLWVSNGGWVPDNAYHLWAPAAVRSGSYYYLYVPDVSDISNDAPPNISTSSRIAVFRSTNPLGGFAYLGTVPYSSGYMSDPDVFIEGSNRYLVWANGDASTCGGFSSARLNSDMRTLVSGSTQELIINGIGVLGNCGGKGRPYMEGASLYKFGESSMPGPYTLVFAVKPTSVPPECSEAWTGQGNANTANEAIAYATANNPQGPYTYRGIIICGSTTEWTNQATIMKVTNANGSRPWMIVYHDSPADIKERKLHAECLFAGGGKIAGVYRQKLNNANGFNDCMNGVNFSYSALRISHSALSYLGQATPLLSAASGGPDLKVNRSAAGPWERFREYKLSNGYYAYRSLANGKYVCRDVSTAVVRARCDSSSDPLAQFIKEGSNPFTLRLASTGYHVVLDGNNPRGLLVAFPGFTGSTEPVVFTEMHLR